jgi:hypothetical protein
MVDRLRAMSPTAVRLAMVRVAATSSTMAARAEATVQATVA